jgi:hypothetical protein
LFGSRERKYKERKWCRPIDEFDLLYHPNSFINSVIFSHSLM